MKRILKKSLALTICTIFLLTSLTVTSESNVSENETITKKVTLLRYGPDGSIKPVEVEIEIEDGQDVDEAITEKCEKLTENDLEIQGFLKNRTSGFIKKVKSSGKGFHFKLKTQLRVIVKKKLLSLSLPKFRFFPRIPLIYCDYSKDPNAYTIISPLTGNNTNATITVKGNHSVFVWNFVGFTSWTGRFSFSPLDVLPRSFSGIAFFVFCKPKIKALVE